MHTGKAEAGCLCFKPDAVIRRKMFFRRYGMNRLSVPVTGRGGNVYQKRHERAIIAVLNTVPMLVSFQRQRGVFAGKEKHSEATASPAFPDLKRDTVAEAFGFMPGRKHPQGYNSPAQIDRKPPCKGAQIEFPIGKERIGCRFLYLHNVLPEFFKSRREIGATCPVFLSHHNRIWPFSQRNCYIQFSTADAARNCHMQAEHLFPYP